MGDAFDMSDLFEGLPETYTDFVTFQTNHAIDKDLLNMGFMLEMKEVWLLPEWLDTVEKEKKQSLFYPLHMGNTMTMGRMHKVMGYITETLTSAGIPVGEISEERYSVTTNEFGDVVFVETCKLDDDSVVFVRNEVDAKGGDRTTLLMRCNANNLSEVYQALTLSFKASCQFCSARHSACECKFRNETSMVPVSRERNVSPKLNLWNSIKSVLTQSYVLEVPKPPGHEFMAGPTVAPLFPPKLLQYSVNSPGDQNFPVLMMEHLNGLGFTANSLSAGPVSYCGSGSSSGRSQRKSLTGSAVTTGSSGTTGKGKGRRAEPTVSECHLCNRTFARKFDLQRHMNTVHSEEKKFECNICDRSFSLRHNLQSHIRDVHEKKRTVPCAQCDSVFATAHKMRLHLRRVHLDERTYHCGHCEYSCFQSSDLQRHVERAHQPPASPIDSHGGSDGSHLDEATVGHYQQQVGAEH